MNPVYFLILGTIVFAVVIFRDQMKKVAALKDFEEHAGKYFTMEKCSNYWFISNLWVSLFCIVVAVYVFLFPNSVGKENVPIYIGAILGLGVVFTAYIISEKRFQNLYMNRDSFYHNGSSYRFSTVKHLEQGKKTCKLTTYTGDVLNVNREKALMIQNEIYKRKK